MWPQIIIIQAIQIPTGRGVAVTVGGIFIDTIMEAIKCLFKTLIDKISSLIVDIVTTLVDDVVNTAFCQISNILKEYRRHDSHRIAMPIFDCFYLTHTCVHLKGGY